MKLSNTRRDLEVLQMYCYDQKSIDERKACTRLQYKPKEMPVSHHRTVQGSVNLKGLNNVLGHLGCHFRGRSTNVTEEAVNPRNRPRYNMAINIKRYIQNKTTSVILSTGGRNVI